MFLFFSEHCQFLQGKKDLNIVGFLITVVYIITLYYTIIIAVLGSTVQSYNQHWSCPVCSVILHMPSNIRSNLNCSPSKVSI